MDDINSETDTNIASNKDLNSSSNTFDFNINPLNPSEKDINLNQNISSEENIDKLIQSKPYEITLDQKIILDSINLYNTISTNYGEKKLDINRLSKSQQEKALIETELLLLNGKKIVHINNLDKYINLKELYLNQNYITEIKGLNSLIKLEVLNLSFNNITKIENIENLINLQILDLSNNLIDEFDINKIPKQNLLYIYMYYNPFFKKMKIYEYRSLIIINFEKIERIDKLQISDRERLLLIEKSNLKYENRLKSLNYILDHYNNYNKNTQEIFNAFKNKIDSDINKVLNKKKENKENILKNKEKNEAKFLDVKNITTTNEPHNDIEDKKILKDIKELKDQSEKFFNESILSLQNRRNVIIEKHINNQKKFKESESVKKLQAQIDLLNEKFKKANFIDPEIKKKFEERIKEAIKFKERITHAEEITNKVIDDFNKKKLNNKNKNLKKNKELESIPEEDNKKEEIKEEINNNNKENKLIKEINEIKLEDSDEEEEDDDNDDDNDNEKEIKKENKIIIKKKEKLD